MAAISQWSRRLFVLTVAAISASGCLYVPAGRVRVVALSDEASVIPSTIVASGPRVRGEDCALGLVGIFRVGHPALDRAVADALAKSNGNALVDVEVNERMMFLVLAIQHCIVVDGAPVRLREIEKE